MSFIYTANTSGNNVSVVDGSSNRLNGVIPVSYAPVGLALSSDGSTLFVSCNSGKQISVIDTASSRVTVVLPLNAAPGACALTPDGKLLYVVYPTLNQVAVIDSGSTAIFSALMRSRQADTRSRRPEDIGRSQWIAVSQLIAVGSRPSNLVVSPDGKHVYVCNLYGSSISVIDVASQTVSLTFATGNGPRAVAVSPDGRILVANQNGNTVTIHDPSTGATLHVIAGFVYPDSVAVLPDGSRAYVVNGNSSSVSVMDLKTYAVMAIVPTGSSVLPVAIALSADGSRAYVTNQQGCSLTVIDTTTNTVAASLVRVGVYPVNVTVSQITNVALDALGPVDEIALP
jgi:YVTN family beta-propeller protein